MVDMERVSLAYDTKVQDSAAAVTELGQWRMVLHGNGLCKSLIFSGNPLLIYLAFSTTGHAASASSRSLVEPSGSADVYESDEPTEVRPSIHFVFTIYSMLI